MAKGTSFIAVHRELLVIKHQLSEQLDLLDLVIGWCGQPLACLPLDAVDLGLDLRDFLQHLRRQRCGRLLRSQHVAAQRDNDNGSSEHNLSDQGATPSFGTDIAQTSSRTAVNIHVFEQKRKWSHVRRRKERAPARMLRGSAYWWNARYSSPSTTLLGGTAVHMARDVGVQAATVSTIGGRITGGDSARGTARRIGALRQRGRGQRDARRRDSGNQYEFGLVDHDLLLSFAANSGVTPAV
jgi:hypothetical protein